MKEARFPANGLVLYMPMTSMSEVYSSDGKASASDFDSACPVEFTEQDGIACAHCYYPNPWSVRSIRIFNVLGSLFVVQLVEDADVSHDDYVLGKLSLKDKPP